MSNLVQIAVANGGKLAPLIVPTTIGAMNPSVFIDEGGDILVNIRVVNYTLIHAEKSMFNSRWGPLSYLHPEGDRRLATENYLCRLDKDLKMTDYTKVEMLELHTPIWEFHGLEDARIYQWGGNCYLVGVRRDTTNYGEGRMEYSHIKLNKKKWIAVETKRVRIPAPIDNNSYCEKNWVGILDRPFHFIKWANPVEVVMANPDEPECTQVSLRQGLVPPRDLRGGSQLVRWGNMYISLAHDVDLTKTYLNQKDAIYRHRLLVWDDQLNLVGISKDFSFLDGKVEFCAGAAKLGEDLLVSFGFQDNAAFVLHVPKLVVEDLILEALNYDN